MFGGTVLCWLFLSGRRRQSHGSRRCRSAKWDTVDNVTINVPNLVLLCLFCHYPRRLAYLVPSSSASDPIISHQLPFLSLLCHRHRQSTPPPTEYAPPLVRAVMRKHLHRLLTTEWGRYDGDGVPNRFEPLCPPPRLRGRIHHCNGHSRLRRS